MNDDKKTSDRMVEYVEHQKFLAEVALSEAKSNLETLTFILSSLRTIRGDAK